MLSQVLTLQQKGGSHVYNYIQFRVLKCVFPFMFKLQSTSLPSLLLCVCPTSQNNRLEVLLLQTWWNMCFIFSALLADITIETKRLALKRRGWFNTHH